MRRGGGSRKERRETEFRRQAAAARHAGKCSPPRGAASCRLPAVARGRSRRQLGGPRGLAARPPPPLRGKVDMLWGWVGAAGGGPAPPPPPEGGGAPAGRVFTSERRKGEPGPCSRVTDPGTPPARRCRRRQGPSSAPAGRAPPAGRHSRACCRAEGGRSSTRCASNYANSPTASPFFEELVFLCLTFWEALALLPWHNLAPFNLGLLEVCGQWAPAQFMAMLCFALPTARVTYQTRQTWLLQL